MDASADMSRVGVLLSLAAFTFFLRTILVFLLFGDGCFPKLSAPDMSVITDCVRLSPASGPSAADPLENGSSDYGESVGSQCENTVALDCKHWV